MHRFKQLISRNSQEAEKPISQPESEIDILLIGHIAEDLQADKSYILGGTVTYAAFLASLHELRVGVVTSGTQREKDRLLEIIPTASIHCVLSEEPTVFENRYVNGRREQLLHSRAKTIMPTDIPSKWENAPLLLLGPIDDEIDPSISLYVQNAIRVATPQGWLRAWDEDKIVYPIPWKTSESWLPNLTALVLSIEDLATAAGSESSSNLLTSWASKIPFVIVTDGPKGATLWTHQQEPQHIPAFPTTEIDPTGAGDTFTTAFLIEFSRTNDVIRAIRYAHAAASFVVGGPGITNVPEPYKIAELLD